MKSFVSRTAEALTPDPSPILPPSPRERGESWPCRSFSLGGGAPLPGGGREDGRGVGGEGLRWRVRLLFSLCTLSALFSLLGACAQAPAAVPEEAPASPVRLEVAKRE